jgi:hypothetical protein
MNTAVSSLCPTAAVFLCVLIERYINANIDNTTRIKSAKVNSLFHFLRRSANCDTMLLSPVLVTILSSIAFSNNVHGAILVDSQVVVKLNTLKDMLVQN